MNRTVIQAELERLYHLHGRLSGRIILDEAQSTRSVLHSEFLWDNEEAGEKYRLQQAHHLIKLFVIPVKVDGHQVITAQWQVAGTPKRTGPNFESILDIMSDAEKEYQLVIVTLERARDILAKCPHRSAQKMAHRISSEIMKIPRPSAGKAA